MPSEQDQNLPELEREARKRVKQLREFYAHAGSFVLVNIFLVILNLITSPGYFWAIWPILGWGIGLISHGVSVFGLFRVGGKSWEERKVREFMPQRQQSLTTSQVRDVLHEEFDDVTALRSGEWERMLRRLENLETIVTSRDWDLLEGPEPSSEMEADAGETDAEESVARLSRRVR